MPIGGTLSDLGGHFDPIAESARRASEQVRELSGDVQRISTQVRNNSQNIQQVIEMLNTSMNGIVSEVRGVTTSIQGLSSALRPAREGIEQQAKTMEDAYKVYREMGLEVRKLGLDLESLKFTESELNKVIKIGTDFTTQGNAKRASSYDALSQRYRAMKILYDNMTESERQNNSEFVAGLRDLYEKMNLLQQATGKYQLQVGNYSKAMTGLNIATQQVLRELPTLANSATTFAIAISNNIPILVDNILAVKKANAASISYKNALLEQAAAEEAAGNAAQAKKLRIDAAAVSTTTVAKGLISSIFSWQTLIIGVLTILPMFLRKLEQKKKAMKENAEATKEEAKAMGDAITLTTLRAKTMEEERKAVIRNTKALESLVKIAYDERRSTDERNEAIKAIKREYPEYLDFVAQEGHNYSTTKETLMGYIEWLQNEALVKSKLNKITELSIQLEDKQREIEQKRTEDSIKFIKARSKVTGAEAQLIKLRERERQLTSKGGAELSEELNDIQEQIRMWERRLDSAQDKFNKVDEPVQRLIDDTKEIQTEIDTLTDEINKKMLETLGKQRSGGKQTAESLKDYYWEYLRSVAEAMDDSVDKEMELSRISYAQKIESYHKELEELRKNGELRVEQEEYLNNIINNLIEAGVKTRWSIIWKWYDKNWQEIREKYLTEVRETLVDEEDMSLSAPFEKMLAENGKKILESSDRLNEKLKDGTLREAKAEGAIYKDLVKEKLSLEEQLAEARLKMDLDTGLITQANYDAQIADLRVKLDNSIAKLDQKRRPKFSIWNLIFGEKRTDGSGNVWMEMTPEMKAFTDGIEKTADYALNYMEKWLDYRLKISEEAVKAAEREANAAKNALDIEQEARANGYANNVEFARREYEKKMELERKALEQKQKYQRAQDALSSASQAASMAEAIANMWAAYTKGNVFGAILAGAATTAALASFTAAKISAYKASKVTYGEGGYEYMNYGGSHASGHDIDFGRTRDGRARRVERGEMVGIINKKNVAKYGVGTIGGIIDSINNGTFEMADKYSLAFQGSNLTTLENGVNALVEQGKEKIVATPWGRIEYSGNVKRIIKN